MTKKGLSLLSTFEIFDLDLLIRHDLLNAPVLQLKLLLLKLFVFGKLPGETGGYLCHLYMRRLSLKRFLYDRGRRDHATPGRFCRLLARLARRVRLQDRWEHCLVLLILLLCNSIPLLLRIEHNLMAGPPRYRPRLELVLVYQGLLFVCPAL
jgi:hypothetical protein